MRINKYFIMVMVICSFYLCCSGPTLAQDVDGGITYGWNKNTENDLAGYKIYIGTASGDYIRVIDVKNVTQYTITGLTPGVTYYAAVTAYDTWTNESGYSLEVATDAKDIILPSVPDGFKEVTTNVNNNITPIP